MLMSRRLVASMPQRHIGIQKHTQSKPCLAATCRRAYQPGAGFLGARLLGGCVTSMIENKTRGRWCAWRRAMRWLTRLEHGSNS